MLTVDSGTKMDIAKTLHVNSTIGPDATVTTILTATIAKIVAGPPQHKLPVWRTGNVNFIAMPEIGVYSPWDLGETVDITQTNQPLLHHPTWKGGVIGVLIALIGQCHWEKTPVSTKITSRQTTWKNFRISSDALNAFGDAPTILTGKTLIQTPASRYLPRKMCL